MPPYPLSVRRDRWCAVVGQTLVAEVAHLDRVGGRHHVVGNVHEAEAERGREVMVDA